MKSVPLSFWSVIAPWDIVKLPYKVLLICFVVSHVQTTSLWSWKATPCHLVWISSFSIFCHATFLSSPCRVLHYDMLFLTIPLAQRVASFSSSQRVQSPCSTFLWPSELWIPTRQVSDMSSNRWVGMVTFQEVFYKLFCKPIVLRVTYLSMLSPSHWQSSTECSWFTCLMFLLVH